MVLGFKVFDLVFKRKPVSAGFELCNLDQLYDRCRLVADKLKSNGYTVIVSSHRSGVMLKVKLEDTIVLYLDAYGTASIETRLVVNPLEVDRWLKHMSNCDMKLFVLLSSVKFKPFNKQFNITETI